MGFQVTVENVGNVFWDTMYLHPYTQYTTTAICRVTLISKIINTTSKRHTGKYKNNIDISINWTFGHW